jgi:hypothetical protein
MSTKNDLLDEDLSPDDIKPVPAFSPILFFVLSAIMAFGLLFKTMQWPIGNISLTIGASVLIGHLCIRTVLRKFDKLDFLLRLSTVLGLMFMLVWFFDFSPTILAVLIGTVIASAGVDLIIIRIKRGRIASRMRD